MEWVDGQLIAIFINLGINLLVWIRNRINKKNIEEVKYRQVAVEESVMEAGQSEANEILELRNELETLKAQIKSQNAKPKRNHRPGKKSGNGVSEP